MESAARPASPDADVMPTAAAFRAGGWGLLGTLFALNFVDDFGITALAVLGPDVQDALGLSDTTLALLVALGGALILVAAGPLAVAADRCRRLTIIAISSVLLGAFTLLTGLAQSAWQLVIARTGAGLGKGNLPAFHSVLADAVPMAGRARVFAAFNSTNALAAIVTPAFVGAVAEAAGGSEGWRWAFVLCAVPAVALGLVAGTLREPERGLHERREALGPAAADAQPTTAHRSVSFAEAVARLQRIRTFHDATLGFAAVGVAMFAVPTFVNLLLEERYGLDTGARGAAGSVMAIGVLVGSLVAGARGDRLYAKDPSSVLRAAGLAMLTYLLLIPAAYMPNGAGFVVLASLANIGMFAAFTLVSVGAAAIVPPHLRAMGFAVVTLCLAVVGGLGGAVLAGALSGEWGERTALVVVLAGSIPTGAFYLHRAARSVVADVAAVERDLRDEEARRIRRLQRGAEPVAGEPLLEVSRLDVAYGQLQILFDVDLEVRRGEVLALLGTNGAGKSTLLRAVTGLTFPSAGGIVFDGEDVTYLDPADRVRHGIVMVPGGKAVFAPLSVEDNLRLGGFLLRDDDATYRRRREEVLDLFPVLRTRLDQAAATLSGGERQMLALAKAMLLRPRLLCIDELSLGLAPVVVQQLLEVVEGLRATGVTMIVVEQSVNVALAMADRAVFMEKGHVRFEGPAAALAARDDLVRAVFLGGARS